MISYGAKLNEHSARLADNGDRLRQGCTVDDGGQTQDNTIAVSNHRKQRLIFQNVKVLHVSRSKGQERAGREEGIRWLTRYI
jgi:hypothetical protein